MASIIEKEAKRMVLYQVPGISRCFLSESRELGQEGTMKLRFEGVNIQVGGNPSPTKGWWPLQPHRGVLATPTPQSVGGQPHRGVMDNPSPTEGFWPPQHYIGLGDNPIPIDGWGTTPAPHIVGDNPSPT